MGAATLYTVKDTMVEEEARTKGLSWIDTAVMQACFSTAGAMVTFPYAVGIFGYVLAPCILIAWTAVVLYTNLNITEAARRCNAKSFGDVGESMAGPMGRHLATLFQMINLVFLLPVQLELAGGSLAYLVGDTACLGVWTLVIFAAVFLLPVQACRTYTTSIWMSYVTIAVLLLKALVLFPIIFDTTSNPNMSQSSDARLALAPVTQSWSDYAGALSLFPYSFTPIFVLVENMSEMETPQKVDRALYAACAFSFLVYLFPGFFGVACWGYSINDPVTDGLERNWMSELVNTFLLLAALNDYVIASVCVSKETQLRLMPRMDVTSYALGDILRWFALTLPYGLFAAIMATCVPSFGTLVGLLTSLTIGITNMTLPSFFSLCSPQRHAAVDWALLIGGLGLSAFMLAGSVIELEDLEWESFRAIFCGADGSRR